MPNLKIQFSSILDSATRGGLDANEIDYLTLHLPELAPVWRLVEDLQNDLADREALDGALDEVLEDALEGALDDVLAGTRKTLEDALEDALDAAHKARKNWRTKK